MNSKTCAQKRDYTYYGMNAKYVKENHAEMYGRKWEAFNEAKIIFRQWEHVLAADQKTTLLAVLLDYLMHHCNAQACEKNVATGVADDRRMGSSHSNFAGVIPEHTWRSRVLAVCSFDSCRCCGYEPFKGKLLSFLCVRVRKT